MRTYERSGITVDQCSECRGIFLDRGELERLVDTEASFHGQEAPPAPAQTAPAAPPAHPAPAYGTPAPQYGSPPPAYGSPGGYDRDRYERDRYEKDRYDRDRYEKDRGYGGSYGSKRRKKSLIEELFG